MEAIAENVVKVIKDFLPEAKIYQDNRKDEWDDAGYIVYSADLHGKCLIGIELVCQYVSIDALPTTSVYDRFFIFPSKKTANRYLKSLTQIIDAAISVEDIQDLRELDYSACAFTRRFLDLLGCAYLEDKSINRANLLSLTE